LKKLWLIKFEFGGEDMYIKRRFEIDGRIAENGDLFYVEYNPAEHCYFKEILIYKDEKFCDIYTNVEKLDLLTSGIYIDFIKYIKNQNKS
jgi:hypothetical protein